MSDPILPYRDLFKHLHEDTKRLRENVGMIHAHFQEIGTLMAGLGLNTYVCSIPFYSDGKFECRLAFDCLTKEGLRVKDQERIFVLAFPVGEWTVWEKLHEVGGLGFPMLVDAYKALPELVQDFVSAVGRNNLRATELEVLTNEFRDRLPKLLKIS